MTSAPDNSGHLFNPKCFLIFSHSYARLFNNILSFHFKLSESILKISYYKLLLNTYFYVHQDTAWGN